MTFGDGIVVGVVVGLLACALQDSWLIRKGLLIRKGR